MPSLEAHNLDADLKASLDTCPPGCLGQVWVELAVSGNFHSLPQSALNPDKMRVLVAVLILALSLGYSFRVEDVFDIFEAGLSIRRRMK